MTRSAWLALFAVGLAVGPVRAQETDVVKLGVGVNTVYDNNLLRLPNDVSPMTVGVPTSSRSAFITNGFGQLVVDLPISRQRVRADMRVNSYRYSGGYSYLNFTGWEGKAQWLYQFGNYWKGDFYYARSEQPAGFENYRDFNTQNIQTANAYGFNSDYWVVRNWHFTANANYTQGRNSASAVRFSNLDQWWAEAGVKYESSLANFLRMTGRYTHGSYPDRVAPTQTLDTEYNQSEVAVDGNWQLTAATRAYGRVAYTARRFPNSAVLDFNGPTWRVVVEWAPTVRTGVNFLFRREIGAVEDITATYILTQGPRISPYWQISPTVRLEGYYEYLKRSYQGDPVTITGVPQIRDRYQYASLGVTWTPTRNWLVRVGYIYSTRSSNFPTRQFDDDSAYGTIQFTF